jgi:hypothetical protein
MNHPSKLKRINCLVDDEYLLVGRSMGFETRVEAGLGMEQRVSPKG